MKKEIVMMGTLAVLLASGCKQTEQATTGSEPTATVASTQEIAGTKSPNDLNPIQAQSFIDDVTIGHEVGADGAIPTGKTGDDFAPGQSIFIAMKVNNAPASSAVKVVFNGKDNVKVSEENKQVPDGAKFLSFEKSSKGWAKGDYTADVYIGDEKVNTQHFQIVDAANAGK